MQAENRALLLQALESIGVGVPDGAVEKLAAHLAAVLEWNQRFNLTRIEGEREAVLKHIVDSATCWRVFRPRPGLRVLDVGSGAGYPGVVLKLLAPEVQMVLLEATHKKCQFLEHVAREVVGSGLEVLWARAEDAGRQPAYRERFDLVVARAVAELRVLVEYALPFVKAGGYFLAMKGPGGGSEATAATRAVERLGGGKLSLQSIALPDGAGERTMILVEKLRSTPSQYPRQAGLPAKRPL